MITKSNDQPSYFLKFFKMAARGEDRLTDAHIAHLAASISRRNLQSIAIRYLGIGAETITSLRDRHRGDVEALNRDILQKWAYKKPWISSSEGNSFDNIKNPHKIYIKKFLIFL